MMCVRQMWRASGEGEGDSDCSSASAAAEGAEGSSDAPAPAASGEHSPPVSVPDAGALRGSDAGEAGPSGWAPVKGGGGGDRAGRGQGCGRGSLLQDVQARLSYKASCCLGARASMTGL